MIAALIGSREAPNDIKHIASQIGKCLSDKGVIGRSGGAIGMDTAFMAFYSSNLSEIYRPDDKGINGINVVNHSIFFECEEMAKTLVPHYEYLDFYSQWLHARNCCQILGIDLKTPCNVVICWAPESNGIVQGGTRTAVTLARRHNIPVSNLWHEKELSRWCSKFNIPYVSKKKTDLSFLDK